VKYNILAKKNLLGKRNATINHSTIVHGSSFFKKDFLSWAYVPLSGILTFAVRKYCTSMIDMPTTSPNFPIIWK